jgi:hypothetical protein
MKCPKCGYHSFEYLDTCKKCQANLNAFKTTHKIVPVIAPRATAAASHQSSHVSPPVAAQPAGQDDFLIGNPAIFSSTGNNATTAPDNDNDFVFNEISFTEETPPAEFKENAWDSPAAAVPLTLGNNSEAQDFPDLFGDVLPQEEQAQPGAAAKPPPVSR